MERPRLRRSHFGPDETVQAIWMASCVLVLLSEESMEIARVQKPRVVSVACV